MVEIPPGHVIKVDRLYYFKPHKIVTKEGKPRKIDISNRIKALDDTLSQLIGIDDSYFTTGSYGRLPIEREGLEESVDVRLTLVPIDDVSFWDGEE